MQKTIDFLSKLQYFLALVSQNIECVEFLQNYYNKLKIPYVIVIGEDEINSNTIKLKNMETGEEETLNLDAEKIKQVIK